MGALWPRVGVKSSLRVFRWYLIMFTFLLTLWPGHPVLLLLLLGLVVVLGLFGLRPQAQRLILFAAHAVASPVKRAQMSLEQLARALADRNRVVLLAQARAETGGFLEKEFRSVDESLRRDLEPFPVLKQRLLGQIEAIEDDHRQSREEPPPAPEWTRAVAALARLKPSGDRSIDPLLVALRKEVTKAQRQALSDYRKSCEGRHRALQAALPALERVRKTLECVDQDLVRLRERATSIDEYMRRYDSILLQEDWVERTLRSSAVIQFLTSAVLAALAAGAVLIHWTLLRSVLTGPQALLSPMAATILVVEAVLGVVITDGLGITALVPGLARVAPELRRRMLVVSTLVLVLAAAAEAALPFAAPIRPLRLSGALLGPIEIALCLGILPAMLAFAAIPLERLIYGLRTVAGLGLVGGVWATAWFLQQVVRLIRHVGLALMILYDALVFLPLALSAWRNGAARRVRTGVSR